MHCVCTVCVYFVVGGGGGAECEYALCVHHVCDTLWGGLNVNMHCVCTVCV